MAANGHGNGERKRLLLLVPLATLISVVWVVCAFRAVVYGDTRALLIASAPFAAVTGWCFGYSLPGKK